MERFLFPRWTNQFLTLLGFLFLSGGAYATAIFLGITDPVTLNVGYSPKQPVPFSHVIHAGQLKMDCRYCHTNVDKGAQASIPATQTCVNCHSPMSVAGPPVLSSVHSASTKLKAVHESWRTGESVPWIRIHRLPDYVFFNHSAHVNRGVSCVTCHGRIDKMEVVAQAKDLSMAWCVDCHRHPEPHIRPVELITKLDWDPKDIDAEGAEQVERLKKEIHPMTNCAVCHR